MNSEPKTWNQILWRKIHNFVLDKWGEGGLLILCVIIFIIALSLPFIYTAISNSIFSEEIENTNIDEENLNRDNKIKNTISIVPRNTASNVKELEINNNNHINTETIELNKQKKIYENNNVNTNSKALSDLVSDAKHDWDSNGIVKSCLTPEKKIGDIISVFKESLEDNAKMKKISESLYVGKSICKPGWEGVLLDHPEREGNKWIITVNDDGEESMAIKLAIIETSQDASALRKGTVIKYTGEIKSADYYGIIIIGGIYSVINN